MYGQDTGDFTDEVHVESDDQPSQIYNLISDVLTPRQQFAVKYHLTTKIHRGHILYNNLALV